MNRILYGIDPGPVASAYVRYDVDAGVPLVWMKMPNHQLLAGLENCAMTDVRRNERLAIEMIASYGMAVGKDVFETCVWIGRFIDRWCAGTLRDEPTRVTRKECALHICNSPRASDANIRAALIDRYGGNERAAVGIKAAPGPLYKMNVDCRAALAVAITAAETRELWTPLGTAE